MPFGFYKYIKDSVLVNMPVSFIAKIEIVLYKTNRFDDMIILDEFFLTNEQNATTGECNIKYDSRFVFKTRRRTDGWTIITANDIKYLLK